MSFSDCLPWVNSNLTVPWWSENTVIYKWIAWHSWASGASLKCTVAQVSTTIIITSDNNYSYVPTGKMLVTEVIMVLSYYYIKLPEESSN